MCEQKETIGSSSCDMLMFFDVRKVDSSRVRGEVSACEKNPWKGLNRPDGGDSGAAGAAGGTRGRGRC